MQENKGKVGAILLVGGFGTRLHPLTLETPKPFLQVAGVPFIDHQIHQAVAAGVSEIVLATSFKSEIFIPHCGDGSRYGNVSIKYAVEKSALGTGGAIRNAAKLLSPDIENIVIFNGDVLSGFNLADEINFHEEKNAWATLYLTTVKDARAFGVVELLEDASIISFREKMENPPTNVINAGCYIFSKQLINYILDEYDDEVVISVEREIFPHLLNNKYPLYGFIDNSYWLDMGTPENFRKASCDLITGVAFSPASAQKTGNAVIASNCQIAVDAQIIDGSAIGTGSTVESGAIVSGSILGDEVEVGANAQIIDSIINKGTKIPPSFFIKGAIYGF